MKFVDMLESDIKITVTDISSEKRKKILVTRKLEEYYRNSLKQGQNMGGYRKYFLAENNLKYSYNENKNAIRFGSKVGYDTIYYVDYKQALDFLLSLDLEY